MAVKTGNAGNIGIEAHDIYFNDGANIQSSALGSGKGCDAILTANAEEGDGGAVFISTDNTVGLQTRVTDNRCSLAWQRNDGIDPGRPDIFGPEHRRSGRHIFIRTRYMNQKIKKIPYGQAEYGTLRSDNCYYVDKTHFIPFLEASPRYIFFIRPRRFGKSLWLSVLQYYYDINDKDRFEEMFKGTYIFEHPTEERNTYLIMAFNFAAVNPDLRYVEESFEENGRVVVKNFMLRYTQFFSDKEREEILSLNRTEHRLNEIFALMAVKKLKLFMFIDEYDNFTNTILSSYGKREYEKLTHGEGFFRFFFNLLKTATSEKGSGLDRLFITGVSPITMDDVTSGMNIGENISLDAKFNELIGFTVPETKEILRYYQESAGLDMDPDLCFHIIKQWYEG